jgi:cytoplasmic iron level regulating protein YaaA (DUF328/UPF0246 family)
MLTVISPAKRLNETPVDLAMTDPVLASDAVCLAKLAKALSPQDLADLMHISPNLAALNHARFADFGRDQTRYPAAFMFDGDTYAGLEVRAMSDDALRWAQSHLRILSGLYGVLRPLDGVQPYRLEMGSRLATPQGRDLYAYWGGKIAKSLAADAAEVGAKVLVNCASVEYFGAVQGLKLRIITPSFFEEKDGSAKIVSFWAKKARGAMARYICENHLTDPDDLRGFDIGGYRYHADQSKPDHPVFTRVYAAETSAITG